VNVTRDFHVASEIGVEEGDGEVALRRTRKRVVFPARSFIPLANTSSPKTFAAAALDSAALVPEVSCATSSAARDVEDTSWSEVDLRYAAMKALHWPQAWGWEYRVRMCDREVVGMARGEKVGSIFTSLFPSLPTPSSFVAVAEPGFELDDGFGFGAARPSKQCRTATYASPQTSISGCMPCRLAMRSSVKTTLPLELFSKGTTPRVAVPFWTAVKTSAMVVQGVSVALELDDGGKESRAA
jgi:hypothetical protein